MPRARSADAKSSELSDHHVRAATQVARSVLPITAPLVVVPRVATNFGSRGRCN
jgi:hypothetical protein